jgi:hypothetical protein
MTNPLSRLQIAGDARLGVASTTSGRLVFQNEANGFVTVLQPATSTLASDMTFTLPGNLGNSYQALMGDGRGQMYWGSVASIAQNASTTEGYAVRWLPNGKVASGILMDNGEVSGVNATSTASFTVAQKNPSDRPFAIMSNLRNMLFSVDESGLISIGTSTAGSRFDIFDETTKPETDLFRVISNIGRDSDVKFKVTASGDIFVKSSIQISTNSNIAESYTALEAVDAGTVVAFGVATKSWQVRSGTSTENFDIAGIRKATAGSEAIGVVSMVSAITLAASTTDGVPVALSGRVPVKITTENGPVIRGDYLTVSTTRPGYAMKMTGEGRSIGRALSDYQEGRDKVMMIVENGYQKLDTAGRYATTTGMLTTGNLDLNANGVAIYNIKSLASANGTWSIDENGRIVAKEICIDGNCADGANFADMIASGRRNGAMQIVNGYAYLLNVKTHTLRVLDTASESVVGTLALEAGVATIAASGNMLYISNEDMSKLYLVDISSPGNPTLARTMNTDGMLPAGQVAGVSTDAVTGGTVKAVDTVDTVDTVDSGAVDAATSDQSTVTSGAGDTTSTTFDAETSGFTTETVASEPVVPAVEPSGIITANEETIEPTP